MSSQYTTEPPPTGTVLVHTTAGPLTISLFAQQTPLTCRNFLQHCVDGTYDGTIFHRIAPNFVIQTGDPTGSGQGGTNIYEDGDRDLERYGEAWGRTLRLPEEKWNDKIDFGDEIHSRLKFNRRGLVGMARMSNAKDSGSHGQYGSQWFITLADNRVELDGKCTMFGRVEGDGIFNVTKIAAAELVDGTERPVYPEKITKIEVLQWPPGAVWEGMGKREKVALRTTTEKPKQPKKKKAKVLLSFGDNAEGEDDAPAAVVKPKKAKFNTALIGSLPDTAELTSSAPTAAYGQGGKRKSPDPAPTSSDKHEADPEPKRRKPSFHEPTTQLPLLDPESPRRSPTPDLPNKRRASTHKSASAIEAQIAALKQSMKRETALVPESKKKLSALEALIPATSTRGRKRPRPGETNASDDSSSLKLLNAFKARLEGVHKTSNAASTTNNPAPAVAEPSADEEAVLCDLHFIANCQSCSDWADDDNADVAAENQDRSFLSHSLTFEKDRLGKDLTWKQKNEEELVVIDPREREKELSGQHKPKRREKEWDKNRDRDRERDRDRNRRLNT